MSFSIFREQNSQIEVTFFACFYFCLSALLIDSKIFIITHFGFPMSRDISHMNYPAQFADIVRAHD